MVGVVTKTDVVREIISVIAVAVVAPPPLQR
jgi:hypothetical protein